MPRETRARLPATVVLLGLTSLFTDVGTEMVYQYGRSGEISVLSYAARYMGEFFFWK